MKKITSILFFLLSLSCSESIDWEKRREKWEPFNSHVIQKVPVDYRNSPYAKHIAEHRGIEALAYMDSLDFYSIAFENDSLLITGFLLQPQSEKQLPVIIFHRGGNRNLGLLRMDIMMDPLARFAQNGYSVLAINYRGNIASQGKDEFGGKDVSDLVYLIESLPSLDGIDTSRIGLLGISRGGMMVYQLLKRKSKAKAAAVIGGMSNLVENLSFHSGMKDVYKDLVPRFEDNPEKKLVERSAYYWTDQLQKIPLQIYHGTEDSHVSVEETRAFTQRLTEIDYPYEYFEYEDNHGISEHKKEVFDKILRHFDQHLK